MSVLVAGGSGAIGSWVVRKLLEEDKEAIIYEYKPKNLLIKDIKNDIPIIQGDILDFIKLTRTIKEFRVKKIIHLAAEMSPEIRKVDPSFELRFWLMEP